MGVPSKVIVGKCWKRVVEVLSSVQGEAGRVITVKC